MTSKEARQARLEVALELGARMSDQEDQMLSKEACKARSDAALELGVKMSDVLEETKIGTFLKLTKIGKNVKSQKGGKKKVLLKNNQVPIRNIRGKFSPHWMDSCTVSEQQPFS